MWVCATPRRPAKARRRGRPPPLTPPPPPPPPPPSLPPSQGGLHHRWLRGRGPGGGAPKPGGCGQGERLLLAAALLSHALRLALPLFARGPGSAGRRGEEGCGGSLAGVPSCPCPPRLQASLPSRWAPSSPALMRADRWHRRLCNLLAASACTPPRVQAIFAAGAFAPGFGIGLLFRLLPACAEPLVFNIFFRAVVSWLTGRLRVVLVERLLRFRGARRRVACQRWTAARVSRRGRCCAAPGGVPRNDRPRPAGRPGQEVGVCAQHRHVHS